MATPAPPRRVRRGGAAVRVDHNRRYHQTVEAFEAALDPDVLARILPGRAAA